MKIRFLVVWAVAVFVFAVVGTSSGALVIKSCVNVSPAEAKSILTKLPAIFVIDVSSLYAGGHLPKAVNYPIDDGTLDKVLPKLDKSKTYLVYGHTDNAALQGAQKLLDAGVKNLYRLKGNYRGWVEAGYPIER